MELINCHFSVENSAGQDLRSRIVRVVFEVGHTTAFHPSTEPVTFAEYELIHNYDSIDRLIWHARASCLTGPYQM